MVGGGWGRVRYPRENRERVEDEWERPGLTQCGGRELSSEKQGRGMEGRDSMDDT